MMDSHDAADGAKTGGATTASPRLRGRWGALDGARRLLVVGVVLAVVGGVLAGAGLWRRHQEVQAVRQIDQHKHEAISAAAKVLVNAYSFDFNSVQASLDSLAEGSTGDFLAQQQQWGPEVSKRVTDQKAVTTAKVDNQALEHFDDGAGTATVLFVFTAESRREKQASITGRQAARVDVRHEGENWKVSAVTPVGVTVPVGESSSSVAQLDQTATAAPSSSPAKAAPSSSAAKAAPTSTVSATPAPKTR